MSSVVSVELVKELRDKTGVSIMECKKALEEAGGDLTRAIAILKERSLTFVAKKSDRTLGAGVVSSYIHTNAKVGSLILLSCETDFVSKNEEFKKLAHDIAMQVAGMRPDTIEALLLEPYIKDSAKTIENLLAEATLKFGERIEVSNMSFFSVAD